MKSSQQLIASLVLFAGLVPSVAGAQAVTDRPREFRDPSSGARIAVYPRPIGDAEFEVTDPSVSIRKQVTRERSVTRIRTADEQIEVTLTSSKVAVKGGGQALEVSAGVRDGSDALRAWFAESTAVRRAIGLLGRVQVSESSPLRFALATARLQLMAMSGDLGAVRADRDAMQRLAARVTTQRASEEGPGECWMLYAVEAIRAWIEYEVCVDSEQWWDVPGLLTCLFLYELQAIGAFSWWLTCVGLGIS